MDKSFEALYKMCMAMADSCLTHQDLKDRFEKLREEFNELFIEVDAKTLNSQKTINEMADVLFVLLHAGHKINMTPFALLHIAASKMFARMNDASYIAKEQRGQS